MSKLEETSIRKLVLALYGAAFRQGELEHRDGVSNATLTKNSETVEAAKNAIIAEVEWLTELAKHGGAKCTPDHTWSEWLADRNAALDAERAKVAKLRETARRVRRTAELSSDIMRDIKRTGGWSGSERVARQFDRIALSLADTEDKP